jgi:photosystem II stability/assembly factor-like uncharacterized protein
MFVTNEVGFIAGWDGLLLKTTDAGNNWIKTPSLTSNDLEDIFFINETKGWIAGERGTVLITSDGGENWDSIKTNIQKRFFSIHFVTENDGWIASEDAIYKTTDGGINWEVSKYQDTTYYYSIYFANNDTGWVAGDSAAVGVILRTTDNGISWHKEFDTQLGYLSTILFIEDSIGYAFGENGARVKSIDFGSSWVLLTPNIFITDNWESAYFINRNVGWIAGGSQSIIDKTTDGGINWVRQTFSPTTSLWLYSIFFTDSITGWAVGVGNDSSGLTGEIFKTTNGGVTFVENEPGIEVTDFKLYQNYPNPFNPATIIDYSIPSESLVNIKIYNSLGEEAIELVNEVQPVGIYKFKLDASNLPSGIYFYRLKSGSFVETKKMVLIR